MSITEAVVAVTAFLEKHLGRVPDVYSVEPAGDGWKVEAEVIEEDEYMRRLGRPEILGIYLLNLDERFDVASFRRIGMRERSSLTPHISDASGR